MHVHCCRSQWPSKKKKEKEKRNDSQFIAKATRAVSALSKRTTPSSLPLLQRAERRRDDGRVKLERDIHGMHETPLVRIAFQPWLVHLLRTKRWHPPTLRGNQTCRGKLFDEDRMTSGPSFHVPSSSSKNYQTLYSIARIFYRSSTRVESMYIHILSSIKFLFVISLFKIWKIFNMQLLIFVIIFFAIFS